MSKLEDILNLKLDNNEGTAVIGELHLQLAQKNKQLLELAKYVQELEKRLEAKKPKPAAEKPLKEAK